MIFCSERNIPPQGGTDADFRSLNLLNKLFKTNLLLPMMADELNYQVIFVRDISLAAAFFMEKLDLKKRRICWLPG